MRFVIFFANLDVLFVSETRKNKYLFFLFLCGLFYLVTSILMIRLGFKIPCFKALKCFQYKIVNFWGYIIDIRKEPSIILLSIIPLLIFKLSPGICIYL